MTPSAVPRPAATSAPARTGTQAADLPVPAWPPGDLDRQVPPGAPRTVSWGGLIEQPAPGAGPHRIRAVSTCADTGAHAPFDFTGMGPLPSPHSVAAVRAAEPPLDVPPTDEPPGSDPLSDTAPVGGLHKFDLGMVPASVTPPRSSRRAAWFAVASSGAAFSGLLLVAATLVGPSTSIDGLQLPGMPRATHFPAPVPERLIAEPPAVSGPSLMFRPQHLPHPGQPPFPHSPPGPAEPPAGSAVPPPRPTPATSTAATEPPGSVGTPPEQVSAAPPRPSPPVTYRGELLTLTDPQAVATRSGAYFAAVGGGDLQAAYAMTTGRLRADGFAAFAAPYRGAASIEVLGVSAASSSTVTTLRITRTDGGVLEQRRRLRFTSGENPRIYADDTVS